MDVPPEHTEFLSRQFEPEIELDDYSPKERELLFRYGAWLKALMVGDIDPYTEGQRAFLEMCDGKRRPETMIEHLWKKHQLDLMFKIALQNEYHIGSRWNIDELFRMFNRLAEQGHRGAMRKCKITDAPDPEQVPLINIKLIYPRNMDIYDASRRLPGSFGSRQ